MTKTALIGRNPAELAMPYISVIPKIFHVYSFFIQRNSEKKLGCSVESFLRIFSFRIHENEKVKGVWRETVYTEYRKKCGLK